MQWALVTAVQSLCAQLFTPLHATVGSSVTGMPGLNTNGYNLWRVDQAVTGPHLQLGIGFQCMVALCMPVYGLQTHGWQLQLMARL